MNTNHNKEVGFIIPKNSFEKKPFVFVELPPYVQKIKCIKKIWE